jgi:hypothetical protein
MSDHRDDELIGPENRTSEEASLDLNSMFSKNGRDLNRLFPDAHSRRLLRDLRRTQRGVDRFLKRLEREADIADLPGGSDEVS